MQTWECREGALDKTCRRSVQFDYVYRSTDPGETTRATRVPGTVTGRVPEATPPACFQPYDPDNPPADVATTETDEGVEVPHIVGDERGTVDRDEYLIAVLFDPRTPWDRWAPQPGWNEKLVIKHGSSCGATYGEGSAPEVLHESRALSRGFAVMSTALNSSGHSYNPVYQVESMLMAKERLIEAYGDVRFQAGKAAPQPAPARRRSLHRRIRQCRPGASMRRS